MDIRQKIGQMFMSRGINLNFQAETWDMIRKGWIGNFHACPNDDTEVILEAQKAAPEYMFVGMDMEEGLCHAHVPGTRLGYLWQLGIADDEELTYRYASVIAREARAGGVNFNYGPVVDWPCMQGNPITCTRAISDDRNKLIRHAVQLVRGFQDNGLITSAKHFPGAGHVDCDTHIAHGDIECSEAELRATELDIYRNLIEHADLSAVMSAHIGVTAIDGKTPATLSRKISNLLFDMGFKGILITDSLAMKGLSGDGGSREVFRKAMAAGNDLVLGDYRLNPAEQFEYMYSAYVDGLITEDEIDRKVAKILAWKARIAAMTPPPPDPAESEAVAQMVAQRSIKVDTAVKCKQSETLFIVTRPRIEDSRNIGAEITTGCDDPLPPVLAEKFPQAKVHIISEEPLPLEIERALDIADGYKDVIFCGAAPFGCYRGTADFSRRLLGLIGGLRQRIRIFVTVGNVFAARELPEEIPLKIDCAGDSKRDFLALADKLAQCFE